jgi:hypothetical protein
VRPESRRRRRILVFLVLVALGALAGLTTASAGGSRQPPPTRLKAYGEYQRGRLLYYQWVYPTGPHECVGAIADPGPDAGFPPPLRLRRGSATVVVLIYTRRRPVRVRTDQWRTLSESGGAPNYPPTRLRSRLRATRRDGRVRNWRVLIHLGGAGPHYLQFYARWWDKKCRTDEFFARGFTVELAPTG